MQRIKNIIKKIDYHFTVHYLIIIKNLSIVNAEWIAEQIINNKYKN